MRRFFLWVSRQKWLGEHLARRPFARRAVRRFLPGETIAEALEATETFRRKRIATVLTQLGENVTDRAEAKAVLDHYLGVLAQINARSLDAHISIKLTQLGLDIERAETAQLVEALARRAAEVGSFVWVDMEDSKYVDATLEVYRRVRGQFSNVGVCLQAYLRRTGADLDALLPLSPSIRLVKGAYSEPASVAFPTRREVDAEYRRLARKLLGGVAGKNGSRVGFGTHDMGLVEDVRAVAGALATPIDAFEIQMLYGIRRRDQDRLAAAGLRVRVLISYGEHWFPWYMRRLAERPANVWFAVRSLLG